MTFLIFFILLALLFIFDESRFKVRFLSLVLMGLLFFPLLNVESVDHVYALYLFCNFSFFAWVSSRFFSGYFHSREVLLGGFALSGLALLLYLEVFSLKWSLILFFLAQSLWGLLPLVLEIKNGVKEKSEYFAINLHQNIVRLLGLMWSLKFIHEIKVFDVFSSIQYLVLSLALFVFHWLFLRKKKADGRLLFESFLTLMLTYFSVLGAGNYFWFGLLIIYCSILLNIEPIKKHTSFWEKNLLCFWQTGGVGGLLFFLSLFMVFNSSRALAYQDLLAWVVLIFASSFFANVSVQSLKSDTKVTNNELSQGVSRVQRFRVLMQGVGVLLLPLLYWRLTI